MRYAHLVHVNGEIGDADYERVLESQDGFQLTYRWLRDTQDGRHVAEIRDDGQWYLENDKRPYTDIAFSDERPELVVSAVNEAAQKFVHALDHYTNEYGVIQADPVTLVRELSFSGWTFEQAEPASDEQINRSFDAYR